MHGQTHILSGWCVSNLIPLSARERALCMLAAAMPDVDAVGGLLGIESDWYQNWHHKLAHNVFFGLAMSAMLTLFSRHRWRALLVYLGLFHLHLLMDYYGSGPGWPIWYFWPFSDWQLINWNTWELYSWQNLTAFAALLLWTIAIIYLNRRTPLEALMPSLDRQIVSLFRREKPTKRHATDAQNRIPA